MQKGLCTELVFSILTLITDHTSGETKRNYQDYDFTNMSSFTLDNLFVKDPSKFVGDDINFQSRRAAVRTPRNNRSFSDIESKKFLNFKPNNINESDFVEQEPAHEDVFMIDKEIKCTEYAPDVFSKLRDLDGITINNLKQSLNPELDANVKKIQKAGEGMGKSGSFFFFSHDDQFLIKTMTLDDFAAFMKMFKTYFEHIESQDNSFLARIYGVY
jgi:hypothetical protein